MIISTQVIGQISDVQNLGEHIEKGKIRLKLKREVFQESSSLKSLDASQDNSNNLGVRSIDNIGKQLGITRIYRVFPFSIKHEPKHREYGLHLWLEVEFDSAIDPEWVVEQYKTLGEIDIAKPVFKKVSINADKKALAVKASKLKALSSPPVLANTFSVKAQENLPEFDDPYLSKQWHYDNDGTIGTVGMDIDLIKAWSISTGDSTVVVSIVDGGIDISHNDLKDNLWVNKAELNGEEGVDDDQNGYVDDIHGTNFVFPGAITPHDHGTHVAGTVGATTNNGIGVAGVAGGDGSGNGVRLMSCQVFDNRTNLSGNFAAAIVYGADMGAVISQNSWGYTVPSYYEPEVLDACRYFVAEAGQYEGSPMKGGILFFAAGNDGLEQTHYPGAFEEVVAVTSTGPEGYPAPYTNYGEWTDIAAPGGDQSNYPTEGGVLSTLPGNKYGFFQGTSMACPHVSGVAALVLSKFGGADMTAEDMKKILLSSTSRFIFAHEDKYGTGILNAANALADDEKIAPEPIDDLEATEIYHNEVRLQWSIPVDQDNFQPAYLLLAISSSEITEGNFDGANILFFENPFDAGSQVQVNIAGLLKKTDYWFAMKSQDMFGNTSDISNIINITTTDQPSFKASTRSIDIEIDVAQSSLHTESVSFSNIGEGLIYWENYVENERYYREEQEELEAEVAAKVDFAASNPELFTVKNVVPKPIASVQMAAAATQDADYWEYDKTVFVAGMSYETGAPAASLVSTYNPNAGLISATRFDVEYDFTFNLTHLEVAMYSDINDKPVIVELKKGSKRVEEAETVYMQEYYSDTTKVFGYQRIPLHRPYRFEDGDIFWVVLHFPKEDEYPLGVIYDKYTPNIFLISSDNGRTYEDLQYRQSAPHVPMLRALSTGDDGAYVFLKPGEGEIAQGQSQNVDVYIDASSLSEGKHLASVALVTNDIHKAYVNLEVKVNVTGQKPQIDTSKIHKFDVYQNKSNELQFDLKNTGLAKLEIYDISSDEPGFAKNFSDTLTLHADYSGKVSFTYTPTHVGSLESKVDLLTNYGNIALLVAMNSKAPALLDMQLTSDVLDIVHGQTGELELTLTNNGTESTVEYDLEHYQFLNKTKSKMSEVMQYVVTSSNDIGGPAAGQWEDISEIGTHYDGNRVWLDSLNFNMRLPYFDEVFDRCFRHQTGNLYFYETGYNSAQLPDYDWKVGVGVIAALMFDEEPIFLHEMIHYSAGNREIFTVILRLRSMYDPRYDEDVDLKYQVVMHRDGVIEYRYKEVNAMTDDMNYIVAIQGMRHDNFATYRNYDETDKKVTDGLVVRFEPTSTIPMILEATPNKGVLAAGESVKVNLTVDPTSFDLFAGTYENNVIVNANTLAGTEQLPFTVNISGTAAFQAVDSVVFALTNIGQTTSQNLSVNNTGTDRGELVGVTFSNSDFAMSQTLPVNIEARSEYLLPVMYSPSSVGDVIAFATLVYSNGVNESVQLKGQGQVDPEFTLNIPADITVDIAGGEKLSVPFSISASSVGADLEYAFINSTFASVVNDNFKKASLVNNITLDEKYAYTWEPSDSTRIFYKWEDISDDSELLLITNGNQPAVKLPFEFPYYGQLYDTIWISKNGYVTVNEPDGEPFALDFEKEDGLSGMIAPFWSPLVPASEEDGVMLKMHDDRVLVQWNDYHGEDGASSGGNISFQLEILADGSIYFHYRDVKNFGGVLQYGLESPDESEFLHTEKSWILDWAIFTDSTTVAIAAPLKSTINSGQTNEFNLEVDAEHIYYPGQYQDTITLLSNSKAQQEVKIPVTLNVTGSPELHAPDSLTWEEVIFSDKTNLKDKITVSNKGHDVLLISKVTFDQLEGITLYDRSGEELIKNSTGTLLHAIEIEPWGEVQISVEIPVTGFADVTGSFSLHSNDGEHIVRVQGHIVESPVFSWTATDQEFSLKNSESGTYTFEIENKGETSLTYDLIPAVIPTGDSGSGSVVIDKIGHYEFEAPTVVDSLALDFKELGDGILTPQAGGSLLGFSNEFVAPEGGFFLTHVKTYNYLKKIGEYVNVMVYVGGDDPQDGVKVFEQKFVIDKPVESEWIYFPLEVPVSIEAGQKFFVLVNPPVDFKFLGYDISSDMSLQEKTYVGVYHSEGNYMWYSTASEKWSNTIFKIRPLTAAGNGQWISLDSYEGEAKAGESVSITASFDAETAGPGEHLAKIIVKSNDVNYPKDEVDVSLHINGAPVLSYRPNQDQDTLKMLEMEELTVNYLATDPEGETLTYKFESLIEGADVSFEQLDNQSAQIKITTDYESSGVYEWQMSITDEAGNEIKDKLVVEILDKNRAPVMNPDFATITLNLADPMQAYTIDPNDLFSDPDGDQLEILAGNYTPEIVDLALGLNYIDIHPLQQGTGFLVFGADDGKENGFVVYGVYVFVINDPSAVDGQPDGIENDIIPPLDGGNMIMVAPNPVVNKIANIRYEVDTDGDVVIEIFDMTGRMRSSNGIDGRLEGTYEEKINVSHLNTGLYFCRFVLNGRLKGTVKMLIK